MFWRAAPLAQPATGLAGVLIAHIVRGLADAAAAPVGLVTATGALLFALRAKATATQKRNGTDYGHCEYDRP